MTTTKELSEQTGIPLSSLQWRCRDLGIPKAGRDYVLTDEQVQAVLTRKDKRYVEHPVRNRRKG